MATLQTFLIIRVVTVLLLYHFDVRSGIVVPIDQGDSLARLACWMLWVQRQNARSQPASACESNKRVPFQLFLISWRLTATRPPSSRGPVGPALG
jgi:hypothetical protein